MLRVGLSGGIGSGKSAATQMLRSRGATVVDADQLAREVVAPGTPGLARIVARFGKGILQDDGSLDRPALGRLIFADPAARQDLEAIVHPAVQARTEELIAQIPADGVLIHDVPLLVEKQMQGNYDLVVIVAAAEAIRLRRLVESRGMDPADAQARIRAQASDEQRRAVADVWLENEGTQAELEHAVDRLWHQTVLPRSAASQG